MKIVYVVETYTAGLGYIDNILPSQLAALGDEVHVLTCGLPMYYQIGSAHFGSLVGRNKPIIGTVVAEGVTIHTCDFRKFGNRLLFKGMLEKIKSIGPDVVIVRGLASPVVAQLIFMKLVVRFELVTCTGQAYSAMPQRLRKAHFFTRVRLFNLVTRFLPGKLFNYFSKTCIGSTEDCVQCAIDFYGINRKKALVIPLGVDVSLFHPPEIPYDPDRDSVRLQFGILPAEMLCIWTGRMSTNKGTPLLARAVEELRGEGYAIRCLFVGAGPDSDTLRSFPSAIVHDFVPWRELAKFYRAADIAVWPHLITTSTLDASASGLPVVMSDEERATERWQGIGRSYRNGDLQSLKDVIVEYLSSPSIRLEDGRAGAFRMTREYSWPAIAMRFRRLFESFDRK